MKDTNNKTCAEAISDDELQAIFGGYSGDNPHLQNVIGTINTRCNYCKHEGTFNVLFTNDAAIVCECPACQKLLRIYRKDL